MVRHRYWNTIMSTFILYHKRHVFTVQHCINICMEKEVDFMAIFTVTPVDDITSLIDGTANPGDVILVEDGVYNQSAVVEKSNIRIIARSGGAIFDGQNMLSSAFILNMTEGVEVQGFSITNYADDAILVVEGGFNRILRNRIINAGDDGIVLFGSTGNLVWRNEAVNCQNNGIHLVDGSTFNWIIGNSLHHNWSDGLEVFLTEDTGNAIIGNKAYNNDDDGFDVFGTNLLLSNKSYNNGTNGFITLGEFMSIVANKSHDNGIGGLVILADGAAVIGNEFGRNMQGGILVNSSANIVQENETECSMGPGIRLAPNFGLNAVIRNKAEDNRPFDIEVLAAGNTLLQNDCDRSNQAGVCCCS